MKMMLTKIGIAMGLLLFIACNSEPSLQRYFVDSSEDPAFQNLSLNPNSLIKNSASLSEEEKKQLNNITKLNILMLKSSDENDKFSTEVQKVTSILKQEQYKSLFNAGDTKKQMEVLYVGETDQIKEFIMFGKDPKMGFVLVRILGDDLSPNNLYKIMKMGEKMDISEIQKTIESFTS
jgi:hypothetical protein